MRNKSNNDSPDMNINSSQIEKSRLLKMSRTEREFEQGVMEVFIAFSAQTDKSRFKAFLEKVERILIIRTLFMFNCNQKDAAKFLGMKTTTLHEKLKKYNITFRKTLDEPGTEFIGEEEK